MLVRGAFERLELECSRLAFIQPPGSLALSMLGGQKTGLFLPLTFQKAFKDQAGQSPQESMNHSPDT